MHTIDRIQTSYIKLAGGQEYPYIEFSVTQQEALYGFHLEITSTKLLLAVTATSLLLGFESMNPVAEAAANTLYDVNAAAAGKRILGDITLDFTTLLTNRIFVQPAGTVGAVTFPDILPVTFGLYLKSDGLRILNVLKTRGDV